MTKPVPMLSGDFTQAGPSPFSWLSGFSPAPTIMICTTEAPTLRASSAGVIAFLQPEIRRTARQRNPAACKTRRAGPMRSLLVVAVIGVFAGIDAAIEPLAQLLARLEKGHMFFGHFDGLAGAWIAP